MTPRRCSRASHASAVSVRDGLSHRHAHHPAGLGEAIVEERGVADGFRFGQTGPGGDLRAVNPDGDGEGRLGLLLERARERPVLGGETPDTIDTFGPGKPADSHAATNRKERAAVRRRKRRDFRCRTQRKSSARLIFGELPGNNRILGGHIRSSEARGHLHRAVQDEAPPDVALPTPPQSDGGEVRPYQRTAGRALF